MAIDAVELGIPTEPPLDRASALAELDTLQPREPGPALNRYNTALQNLCRNRASEEDRAIIVRTEELKGFLGSFVDHVPVPEI